MVGAEEHHPDSPQDPIAGSPAARSVACQWLTLPSGDVGSPSSSQGPVGPPSEELQAVISQMTSGPRGNPADGPRILNSAWISPGKVLLPLT